MTRSSVAMGASMLHQRNGLLRLGRDHASVEKPEVGVEGPHSLEYLVQESERRSSLMIHGSSVSALSTYLHAPLSPPRC